MKTAVRYQSRGGNTKTVAEAIAKAAGGSAAPIDVPLDEPVDLLFVGGGVYAWDIDPSLKQFLEALDPSMVKSVAAFSTAGGMSGTDKIAAIVKAKGISVHETALSVKLWVRHHSLLGGKALHTLTENQQHAIDEFVQKILR